MRSQLILPSVSSQNACCPTVKVPSGFRPRSRYPNETRGPTRPDSTDSIRSMVYDSTMIATGGYAIVASKQENKVAIVDLSPLFAYMHKPRWPGDNDKNAPQWFISMTGSNPVIDLSLAMLVARADNSPINRW